MYQKQRPLDVGFAAFVQRQTKIHDRIIRLTLMKYLLYGYDKTVNFFLGIVEYFSFLKLRKLRTIPMLIIMIISHLNILQHGDGIVGE